MSQPICDACWRRRRGDAKPYRMEREWIETERCAWCGIDTTSGIYELVDPSTVPYPAVFG